MIDIDYGTRRRIRLHLGTRYMRRANTKISGPRREPKPRAKLAAAIVAWDKAGRPEVPRRK